MNVISLNTTVKNVQENFGMKDYFKFGAKTLFVYNLDVVNLLHKEVIANAKSVNSSTHCRNHSLQASPRFFSEGLLPSLLGLSFVLTLI